MPHWRRSTRPSAALPRGEGSVALVAGAAGVGKSELVAHFVGELDREARVLWAICDDVEGPQAARRLSRRRLPRSPRRRCHGRAVVGRDAGRRGRANRFPRRSWMSCGTRPSRRSWSSKTCSGRIRPRSTPSPSSVAGWRMSPSSSCSPTDPARSMPCIPCGAPSTPCSERRALRWISARSLAALSDGSPVTPPTVSSRRRPAIRCSSRRCWPAARRFHPSVVNAVSGWVARLDAETRDLLDLMSMIRGPSPSRCSMSQRRTGWPPPSRANDDNC
jgi:hypothetical protein